MWVQRWCVWGIFELWITKKKSYNFRSNQDTKTPEECEWLLLFIIQSELRLFFFWGGGGTAVVTCLVLISNPFYLFCILRSREGNCACVSVLLFCSNLCCCCSLIACYCHLLLFVICCCYKTMLLVGVWPLCKSILQASVCSEFVKQRKTQESKTWNNSPQGARQVKVISRACACTPFKFLML